MKECKKCGNNIPYKIVIDGKQRILNNRVYCLKCSPFGSRNTKNLLISEFDYVCKYCKKPTSMNRSTGDRKTICKSCRQTKRRYNIKIRLLSLLGNKCIKCGYNKSIAALQFHHRNEESKRFQISGNECRKYSIVKEEALKCDLLCANCHAELHHKNVFG